MNNPDINLRHLVQLAAVCDNKYSVSLAASRLNVAQSVVSRNIQALELAFGGPLFIRRGRRLIGATPLCEALIERVRDINMRLDDLHNVAAATRNLPVSGEIRISCTHLQARYIMPQVLKDLRDAHPNVRVVINQCLPRHINRQLLENRTDLGICTEALDDGSLMSAVKAYTWVRALVCRRDHRLAKGATISLRQLAAEPTITYVHGVSGRRAYDNVFVEQGLFPNVVIAAADSDVIKQFAREGFGVGIVAHVANEQGRDKDLVFRQLPRQFRPLDTSIHYRRDQRLNEAKRLFIELFCHKAERFAQEGMAYLA